MKFIGRTDVGRVRTINEDTLACDAQFGFAVLADGMGGLLAGEVASQAAVGAVCEALKVHTIDTRIVTDCIDLANSRVRVLADDRKSLGNMGTTLVLWAFSGSGRCIVGHVGDSRAYRYRDHELLRLTSDHSVVQGMVDEGLMTPEQAQVAPNRNVITRAVGLESTVVSEVVELDFEPGDRFLLCSDGLSDMLPLADLEAILNKAEWIADKAPGAADELITAANQAGGTDNISLVLIVPG
ncbi:MAG: protein phosphatase 2C domain-containing protein [Gammaproteobacteria bacterium]|nr:protein phosphatase 2C domain-containing protein [Gammaproteobacteria bacterium]